MSDNPIERSLAGRVPTQKALAFFTFEKTGKVQRLLHSLKYQDQKELGLYIGSMYAAELNESGVFDDVTMVVPVPLHKNKQAARGYNQSEWFAKGLADGIKKPLHSDLLLRVKESSTQTRKKKYERWENVKGVFKVKEGNSLSNEHVLLVDDVITTGATIESAWYALNGFENVRLSVAGIAFAPA